MKNRTAKPKPKAPSSPRRTALKADPTRTAGLRRRFCAEVKRRFRLLRLAVVQLVAAEDAFGLKPREGWRPPSYAPGIKRNAFCPTGPGGGVDPSCSPGDKVSRGDVIERIMKTNPPEQVKTGKITKEEWASVYLSDEPGGYAVMDVHPGALNLPLGDTSKLMSEKIKEYKGKDASSAAPVVVDSNDKIQARIGGGRLEQAYGMQSHTVIDGKHRVAAALERGDKSIRAIVPVRKASEISKTSHAIELAEFAKQFAESKGHQILSISEGPRVTAKTKEGYERHWGPTDLEKIAGKVGHTFRFTVNRLATNARQFEFRTDADKVEEFQRWLKEQYGKTVAGHDQEKLWSRYVGEGYRNGARAAFDKARPIGKRKGKEKNLDFFAGTKQEFLRGSFANPRAVERVKLLAGRAFDDLENVTADMSARMSRVLADALVRGNQPAHVARRLVEEVGLGENRAMLIARTEIVRAHNEAILDTLEDLGHTEVGVNVEWEVLEDDKLCVRCEAMRDVVLPIEDARGMLPLHPACRCSWSLAPADEDPTPKREVAELLQD